MPEEAARYLAEDIDLGVSFKDNFTVEMKPDMRHCIVRYNGQVYQGRVMDLPCIIESQKTTDRKNFYKTADISQMIICTQDDDGTAPIRGSAAYLAAQSSHNRPQPINTYGRDNREFQYLHGITPPLKNVLRRRFRKTRKKRSVDMPQIEKEVKNLLRADLQADCVTWEVVWSEPPSQTQPSATGGEGVAGEGDKTSAATVLSSSASVAALDPLHKPLSGTRTLADIDEEAADDTDDGANHRIPAMDNLFGVISSSSDDSEATYSDAPSNSDVEEDVEVEAETATTGAVRPPPEKHLGSQFDVANTAEETTAPPVERMKNDLAAELVLSPDSNDDDDEEEGVGGNLSTEEMGDFYPLRNASDAATAAATAEIAVLNEAVGTVDLIDDEDDDFVPAGGELLADDETVAIYPHDPSNFGNVMGEEDEDDEEGEIY
ncbi:Transcription initiation factor TFIID subunit 7 [Taenia crassiceps]|uniref:Transcription initiation factor TFIID subunit 7 n=1 Tax=Taenia crassiceps TaxID=6207 RepID=A0ABR4QFC7_9CEST